MFTFLELENYRGFEHYRLNDLRRVNLLVGKNNCGKTSVLEAVQLLATGSPSVLATIAKRRGELAFDSPDFYSASPPSDIRVKLSHFFNGHEFGEGSRFSVTSDEKPTAFDCTISRRKRTGRKDFITSTFVAKITTDAITSEGIRFPTLFNGSFLMDDVPHVNKSASVDIGVPGSVEFIDTDSLNSFEMSRMWDTAIVGGLEKQISNAMRILEPQLEDVQFLSSQSREQVIGRVNIVVKLKSGDARLPLGTLGEGMRRLLGLALALTQCRNGVLLIDEIDTGLHYSVMGDLWKLVVSTAVSSNVQVFATTHSLDCVRGLAWMCEHEAHLADQVSLQKIDPELKHAVALSAEEILIADQQHIEMR